MPVGSDFACCCLAVRIEHHAVSNTNGRINVRKQDETDGQSDGHQAYALRSLLDVASVKTYIRTSLSDDDGFNSVAQYRYINIASTECNVM